jgi:hypothetical protein
MLKRLQERREKRYQNTLRIKILEEEAAAQLTLHLVPQAGFCILEVA